jgi:DNA-binding transcriptional ArsR family regulator
MSVLTDEEATVEDAWKSHQWLVEILELLHERGYPAQTPPADTVLEILVERDEWKRIALAGVGHPIRLKILEFMDGLGLCVSPAAMARELKEPLGNISYHVKILLEKGFIELAYTRPVRGATEHFYRKTS